MKKITLLLLLLSTVSVVTSQTNLVVNPGFETWNTLPDPWYVVSTSVTGVTPAANTSIFFEGDKSCKIDSKAASGTYNVAQSITISPSHQYTLVAKYYIAEGDGSDARLWCNYKKDAAYFSETELVATGDYEKLRSGNANQSGTLYLPDVKGSWQTYTATFTAPSNATGFDLQFRTYKTAVVYWDGMSLVDNTLSGVFTPKTEALNVWKSNGSINFNALEGETVEVYNAVGQRLMSQATVEGLNSLKVDSKGLTIVKIANRVGKIML